jgi:O-antigen/teichoic acid export membrane protein
VLESVLASVGLFIAYRYFTRSKKQGFSVDLQRIPLLLAESVPYFWSGVAILLYMKIDVVMLGYLSTSAETGIYSLAQKLSEVLYMVPVVLIDSAYPSLAKKFFDADKKTVLHGQILFDLAVGGSLLAALTAVAVAGIMINIIFGEAYNPSIKIFYFHAWSCVQLDLALPAIGGCL